MGFNNVQDVLIETPKKSIACKIALCVGAVVLVAGSVCWLSIQSANSENIEQIKNDQSLIRADMHEWANNSNRVATSVESLVEASIKSNNDIKAIVSESNFQNQQNQVEVISKLTDVSSTTTEIASSIEVLVEETVKTNAEVSKMVSIIEDKDKVIKDLTAKLETTQNRTNSLHNQLVTARVEVEKVKADNQGFFSRIF